MSSDQLEHEPQIPQIRLSNIKQTNPQKHPLNHTQHQPAPAPKSAKEHQPKQTLKINDKDSSIIKEEPKSQLTAQEQQMIQQSEKPDMKDKHQKRSITEADKKQTQKVKSCQSEEEREEDEQQKEQRHAKTVRSQLFETMEVRDRSKGKEKDNKSKYQQIRKPRLFKPLMMKSQVVSISLGEQEKGGGEIKGKDDSVGKKKIEEAGKDKTQEKLNVKNQSSEQSKSFKEEKNSQKQNQKVQLKKPPKASQQKPSQKELQHSKNLQQQKQHHQQHQDQEDDYQTQSPQHQNNLLYDTWKSSSNWNSDWNKTGQFKDSAGSQHSPERIPGKFRSRQAVTKPLRQSRAKSQIASRKKKAPTAGKDLKYIQFERVPKVDDEEWQLLTIGKQMLVMFGVDDDEPVEFKKYKNCVCYKIEGYQLIWYYEGNFYLGEFNSSEGVSEKHGYGIQIHPEKYIYEGNFKKGSKEGYGRIRYANGDYYEGEWLKGIKNGQGILTTKSGDKYQGMFLNGVRHGHGKETFKNGDVYTGNYRHNKFDGDGNYQWANGSVYKGEFAAGLRSGEGSWKSKQNPPYDEYNGTYLNGKKNGKGVYKWANGSSYEGEFLNDLKHGQGIMRFPGGKVVRAMWEAGVSIKKLYCEEEEQYKQARRNQSLAPKISCMADHQESPLPYPRPPPRKRSFSKCIEWCG